MEMDDMKNYNSDFNTFLTKSFSDSVNDGIILGLKESLKILHQFLDKKVQKGYPEYISRTELQVFLETYINDTQENMRL